MREIVFCSVAFGDIRYIEQLRRLGDSIVKFHPEATFFYLINEFPQGSRHHLDSLYGFKAHAVKAAKDRGHKKIIWFDPAVIVVSRLDEYFEMTKEYGIVGAQDDNLLANYCGNIAYNHFGYTREESRNLQQHLIGGSIYVFDFDIPLCNTIFDKWFNAEQMGLFGSHKDESRPEFRTHRADESVMALALYSSGSRPVPYDKCKYNNGEGSLVIKKHFK